MSVEYETKVLEIDVKQVEKKLIGLGAEKTMDTLMRRWIFNLGPLHGAEAEWVRLRDEGNKIEMTYKKRNSNDMWAAEEYDVEVSDFDQAYQMLSKLQWEGIFYQENKRKIYEFDGIEFCLDQWPMIPPYLEVETESEEKVLEGLKMLWMGNIEHLNMSWSQVYEKYGIDIHEFAELKFEK